MLSPHYFRFDKKCFHVKWELQTSAICHRLQTPLKGKTVPGRFPGKIEDFAGGRPAGLPLGRVRKGGNMGSVEYITVRRESSDEFVERKSRFIGSCKPVATEEEAPSDTHINRSSTAGIWCPRSPGHWEAILPPHTWHTSL